MTTKAQNPADAYTDLVSSLEERLGRTADAGGPTPRAPAKDAYTDLVNRLEETLDRSAHRDAAPVHARTRYGHNDAEGPARASALAGVLASRRRSEPSEITPSRGLPGVGALRYGPREMNGRSILAADPPGGARIVEVLGDLATADHVAVVVPGNGHHLGNYFTEEGPNSPRARGELLLRTLQSLDPHARVAVVVWVGYLAPPDLAAAASNLPARDGAPDLARLTQYLPCAAHVTLIGHSYGSTVCGLALATARVDDCVALGSPGMGVWRRHELGPDVRLWAAQADSDWIRFFPRARFGSLGLGRHPLHPELGATRFRTGDISGHSGYFREGSESLLNIARITLGRRSDVTSRDASPVRTTAQRGSRVAAVA
ncbi:alpha/beta hydrolase [Cellulosimicrobium cellulans]|uniref:alpha/beta hydrolase n=1 Tax=Cellulosimicrobium cellulans TaxID=1710 RepID=UPI00381623F0